MLFVSRCAKGKQEFLFKQNKIGRPSEAGELGPAPRVSVEKTTKCKALGCGAARLGATTPRWWWRRRRGRKRALTKPTHVRLIKHAMPGRASSRWTADPVQFQSPFRSSLAAAAAETIQFAARGARSAIECSKTVI